jgi:hypothetical protein
MQIHRVRGWFVVGCLMCAACATTAPAPPAATAGTASAAQPAPAAAPAGVVAKQEQLCQAQPAATKSQFDEILVKVSADLKADGKPIKIAVAQVDNTECSISNNHGRFVVDIIQNMSLAVESTGKAPALGNAALSYCHALAPATDGSGFDAGPCENSEALERFNIESVQTAINEELYKLEKMRIQID